MRKNPGRKLRRKNQQVENNRAYLDGTKFEDDGISKTRKYADNRQKRYGKKIHSDSNVYTTFNRLTRR